MGQAYDIANALGVDMTMLMLPPSEDGKKKEETIQLLVAYEKADDVTKEMVRRILKI